MGRSHCWAGGQQLACHQGASSSSFQARAFNFGQNRHQAAASLCCAKAAGMLFSLGRLAYTYNPAIFWVCGRAHAHFLDDPCCNCDVWVDGVSRVVSTCDQASTITTRHCIPYVGFSEFVVQTACSNVVYKQHAAMLCANSMQQCCVQIACSNVTSHSMQL